MEINEYFLLSYRREESTFTIITRIFFSLSASFKYHQHFYGRFCCCCFHALEYKFKFYVDLDANFLTIFFAMWVLFPSHTHSCAFICDKNSKVYHHHHHHHQTNNNSVIAALLYVLYDALWGVKYLTWWVCVFVCDFYLWFTT